MAGKSYLDTCAPPPPSRSAKLNFDDTYAPPRKTASAPQIILTLINLLLTDIVLYGAIIPLVGAYAASALTASLNATPRWELVLVVGITFILMYAVFTLIGEVSFWKHLFAFESCYANLLLIRDLVNFVVCSILVFQLASTIDTLVNQKQGMKPVYLNETTIFQVVLKSISGIFGSDSSSLVASSTDGEELSIDIGTCYIICWAMLTSSVAKLVYFNTLNIYIRSIEIFISMNPRFGDDEDDDSDNNESCETIPPVESVGCSMISPRFRMERDLATTAKKLLRR